MFDSDVYLRRNGEIVHRRVKNLTGWYCVEMERRDGVVTKVVDLMEYMFSDVNSNSDKQQYLVDDKECSDIVVEKGWCRCVACGSRVRIRSRTVEYDLDLSEWATHKINCSKAQFVFL